MTGRARMGLVGLGVMGRNLALNMADKGVGVAAHDPWPEARTRLTEALAETPGLDITVTDGPADLVASLPAPRAILIMVKAGEPVDAVIASLTPLLAAGDTLIDGGNSHYLDTQRRAAALEAMGLRFIGLGISGGEEGARHGPSLMAGGAADAYETCRPVLEAIAARFDGQPCCARVGGDGAGHFVKMIHNGIEYGIMQAIAEAFVLLRDLGGMDHAAMAETFRQWNDTALASYLIEITAAILDRRDDLGTGPLVEAILDTAGQKGTGRWSSEAALALGIPTPTITEAVFARALAALRNDRVATAAVLPAPAAPAGTARWEGAASVEAVRQALLGAVIATFAQGLAVIQAGVQEHGWDTDMAKVVEIWRSGCVIRARLLDDIARSYRGTEAPGSLLRAPTVVGLLTEAQDGWRRAVALAVTHGVPVPALSSALAYVDGARSDKLWANMIQAQRDFFGAHTYERLDRPGSFHTEWIAPKGTA
ncbi:NADP-dependent phosphogluconate dehydrogenase [Roseospira visakhapatnamensis]|uniref:6-phosphogluconate dehydrogenase, decarboxylating n=1 Tax=Roseospira visakhapatnamensis TaxID=390880 RepID=A0A7W6RDE9_9PROT|nr:NADP-dependent phosphogluconate dehydrogenase [Roseospira visakhapatnamensis]MBB4266529.1 6-phosphogluconate dehydrogenase [Roseospira visakhapatnamensis]